MTSVRVVTQNIDMFLQTKGYDLIIGNLKNRADVILLQEAKEVDLSRYIDDEWAGFQDRSSSARAGSAILWRRSLGTASNRQLFKLVEPHGYTMETRYIASVDITDEYGRVTRYASVHYPPQRYRALWPLANRSVTAWLRKARKDKVAFVLGGDYNDKVQRHGVAGRFNLITRNVAIDGFIVSRRLTASKAQNLGNNRSDHDPLRTVVRRKLRGRKK